MIGDKVRDVMTPDPVCLPSSATLTEAAEQMRLHNIGDVLVFDGQKLTGVVTDRDIVVRGIAYARDPGSTTIAEVASDMAVTVAADDSTDEAIRLMRQHALRRLPVERDNRIVGVVTLGDLAVERDPESALADISMAVPNR